MKSLEEVRADILAIDKKIAELYEERMLLTKKTVDYRLKAGEKMFDFLPVDRFDFKHAKVVFQGVEGAYSQQALQEFFGADTESYNVETWRDAMEAIAKGEADYAVLPIENSSAGIVSENFDLLVEYENSIIGEQIIKIDHCLLGIKGAKLSDITDVYSHPQALMQCSKYLGNTDWEKHSMKNTAGSAQKVQEDKIKNKAAIAAKITADIYDLEILAEAIQNNTSNATKFIIVAGKKAFQKEAGKISICFEIPHKSGSLYQALSHLIYNNLNMTKIESRPIQGKTWEYRFFIDIDGNLMDANVQNALQELENETEGLKILGNY
ncbi:MAG: prephenate dehydratase [Lachnospiraceae bacterium]|nr:prephenate dehydratase [Lachnospiraceae bacterium]